MSDVVKLPEVPRRPTMRQQRIEQWRAFQADALTTRDEAALERQLSRGKLLARERIEQLLDPGSFQELWTLVTTADVPSLRGRRAHGDGIVAGWGTVEGRRVFVFAQDPTVIGGSLGEAGGTKVHKLMDLAIDAGAPIVGINDGGGARIQEGVASLCAFGGIFLRNTRASGVVPQISLVMGTATGGAVYSPALTDFVFMVEGTSTMAITGPKVVKAVTGEDITLDDLGGASVHTTRSGVVHFVTPDEQTCLETTRRLLGFLPSSNRHHPPVTTSRRPPACDDPSRDGSDPLALLPAEDGAPYDVRQIVTALVDAGDLLEYAERWAPSIVCGFARLQGRPTGVVANQPAVQAGRLDMRSCEKAARFLRTCDAFNLPVVTVVDCPGLAVADDAEQVEMVRAAAKLAFAYAEANSPRVHLIVGRAHGAVAAILGATTATSDLCLAWPTADVALAPSPERNGPGEGGPYEAAMRGIVDQVVEPSHSRAAVVDALAVLATVERNPVPRKHENLPL